MQSINNIQQDALRILNAAPDNYLILLPDAPRFTIVGVTDSYLSATYTRREDILGRPLFEVFTDNPYRKEATGVQNLAASLAYVLEHKQEHRMADQRYDVPHPTGEAFVYKVWRPLNRPVFNDAGEIQYILHHGADVTELVKIQGIEQAYNLFMQAPAVIGIVRGKNHVLQTANAEAFKLWGRGPEIIGKPLLEAIPELKGQGVIDLFDQVLHTGEMYLGKVVPVTSVAHGKEEKHYFDLVLQPLYEEGSSRPAGVSIMAHDVSQMVAAQKKVAESEERLQRALEAANMGAWDHDLATDDIIASVELKKIFGLPPDSLFNYQTFINSVVAEDRAITYQETQEVMLHKNGRSEYHQQFRIKRISDGKVRWIRAKGKLQLNEAGKPYRVTGTLQDFTHEKKVENALKESEERFRTMANSIPQLAWMTDETGYIYWYNNRWYEYTGTTPEEMLGWGWQKVHHPDLVEGVVHRIRAAFESGVSWEDIFLLRSHQGEYRWFLSRAVPVRREDGTLIGWFGTNTDITEQRKTKEALEKSEEQLLLAMEGGELGYFDYNPRTGNLKWSDRTKELFGLPPQAPVDYNRYLGALYPEDRERTHAAIQKALDPKIGVYENEYRVVDAKDGRLRWLRSKAKVFFDEQGAAYRLAGVTLDITKQKEAEEALQRSESNLRNLVLQAPVAMCIGSGPCFTVEVVNDRMLEIWGKRREEIRDRPVFDVLAEAAEQGLKQVVQRVYATGERFTANEMPIALPRHDRMETVYLNFVYEPIKNREGAVTKIIAVAIDVTDQVVARKKVEESHKEFQFAMDFLPQIFWLTWPDGFHYYYNQQWYDYTGLPYNKAKGEGWHALFHPDDQDRAWKLWQHSLATGAPYEIEYRLRRHDGQYHWFLARALPLRDETGAITKWFGTCTDIHDQITFTEQLETMVAERTKELHRSNEELQQFVHVSSHDLKEPVRKIKTFVNRIEEAFHEELGETGRFYLSRVQTAANRIFAMIDGVLTYSTISAWEEIYEPVDLNDVVRSVESDLELAIQQTGATLHYGPLPRLEGAPVMLHQLFYNLISNSLKFARAGVPPVLTITSEILEHQGKAVTRIAVQDNGIGFEQKYAEKIFGTFIRLHPKDKYEGAGLGLALCKKIVERHGGSIVAKGAENIGTVMELLLPLQQ
ncbi:PAS domain-containing protein [Paraflavisolibacter sp. H34]|uniref:PAS domain-containing protein n=1 Tax=Huijunlia imazamoxiresistens TaxID=3127457 RepID=UPI0030160B64